VGFAVLLHPKAVKELEKLEYPIRTRIVECARSLGENPTGIGKPLRQSDFWSLRIGDYWVICQIDQEKNQVMILFVGHRSIVYDDFSL
jgi:mRNA-degrading endonuclease RelE of RelBE toxin-antitoxin system